MIKILIYYDNALNMIYCVQYIGNNSGTCLITINCSKPPITQQGDAPEPVSK